MGSAYQLSHPDNMLSLSALADTFLPTKITAIAGIGNPQRFFDDLQEQGIPVKGIALPDHGALTQKLLDSITAQCILITEKDAVKCTTIDDERIWVVPMTLTIPDTLSEWLQSILQRPDPNRYTL